MPAMFPIFFFLKKKIAYNKVTEKKTALPVFSGVG